MRPAPRTKSVSQDSRVFPTRVYRRGTDHKRNFGPSRDLVVVNCGDLDLTEREFDLLELIVQIATEQPRVFGADEAVNANAARVVVGLADGILSKLRRVRPQSCRMMTFPRSLTK